MLSKTVKRSAVNIDRIKFRGTPVKDNIIDIALKRRGSFDLVSVTDSLDGKCG